ncbi:37546_t:CDS:1, partial [Gigaspora margarita]
IKETLNLIIHQSTVGHLLKWNNNTLEEMPAIKRSRAVIYPKLDNTLHE